MVELVGILNITPDSFSDAGLFVETSRAVARAQELFAQGAAIVDVGAESTNPKSSPITISEEWRRLRPVLAQLYKEYPGRISVDSFHPENIRRIAEQIGTDFIVNDVTGMNSSSMRAAVAQYGLRCIVSHLPARFGTDIHAAHKNADMDDEQDVVDELLARRAQLEALGVPRERIILDPGIGFGKTMPLNERLLKFAARVPDAEVMIGYSRKRFLGEHRMELAPNLVAGKTAIRAGARYLRVHDVIGHRELLEPGVQ